MLLTARAATGAIGSAELDEELAQTGTAADVVAHLKANASLPGSTEETIVKVLSGTLSNDHVSALIDGLNQPLRAAETTAALPEFFDQLVTIWTAHSQEISERIIYGLYPMTDLDDAASPEDNVEVIAAKAWIDERSNAPEALRKIVIDCNDEHRRMLRAQAAARRK